MPSFSLRKLSPRKPVNGKPPEAIGVEENVQSQVSTPSEANSNNSISISNSESSREQKKARRNSRRDILHDFIHRSIRGTTGAGPGGRSTPQRAPIPETTVWSSVESHPPSLTCLHHCLHLSLLQASHPCSPDPPAPPRALQRPAGSVVPL